MTNDSLNRIPKEHDLKIWQRHFEAVLSGKKKAEHRVNDRDFQEGDTLLLREVTEPECEYTGRKLYVTITHIIRGGEMDILSIEPQDTVSPREISDTNSVAVDMAMVRFNILYCLTNELSGYNDQQMSHLAKELCEAVRPYVATRERESITLEAAARILARDDGETDEYESLEWHKYVKAARTLLIAAGVSYAE